jgi:hypothetical protein
MASGAFHLCYQGNSRFSAEWHPLKVTLIAAWSCTQGRVPQLRRRAVGRQVSTTRFFVTPVDQLEESLDHVNYFVFAVCLSSRDIRHNLCHTLLWYRYAIAWRRIGTSLASRRESYGSSVVYGLTSVDHRAIGDNNGVVDVIGIDRRLDAISLYRLLALKSGMDAERLSGSA